MNVKISLVDQIVPTAVLRAGALSFLASLAVLVPTGEGAHAQGKPLSVQKVLQPLEYGLIASTATPGTVTIDSATGTKSVAGGAVDMGGLHTRASFRITGERNRSFSITLPVSITISTPGGGSTTITALESTPALIGTLDSTGRAYVYVGGVLQVGSGQVAGTYTSVFDITVDYLP